MGLFFLMIEGMTAYVAFLHGEQLIAQMIWGLLLIGLTVFLIVRVVRSKLTRERKMLALVLILALFAMAYAFFLVPGTFG